MIGRATLSSLFCTISWLVCPESYLYVYAFRRKKTDKTHYIIFPMCFSAAHKQKFNQNLNFNRHQPKSGKKRRKKINFTSSSLLRLLFLFRCYSIPVFLSIFLVFFRRITHFVQAYRSSDRSFIVFYILLVALDHHFSMVVVTF